MREVSLPLRPLFWIQWCLPEGLYFLHYLEAFNWVPSQLNPARRGWMDIVLTLVQYVLGGRGDKISQYKDIPKHPNTIA